MGADAFSVSESGRTYPLDRAPELPVPFFYYSSIGLSSPCATPDSMLR
jgi:hypothetical protein